MLSNDVGENCPLAGTVSVVASTDLSCTGTDAEGWEQLNIDGTWIIAAVVNGDGTVTITVSDGTTTWQETKELDCGPQV